MTSLDAVRGGLAVEVRFVPTRGGKAVPVFAPAKGGARVGKFAAIAGIGQTEFSKDSGRSELQLAAEASKAALDDAGIDPSEVDGMITFTIDNSDEIGLCALPWREGPGVRHAHPRRRRRLGRYHLPGRARRSSPVPARSWWCGAP